PHHLGIAISDRQNEAAWWHEPQTHLFFHIKGLFEALQQKLGWSGLRLAEPAPAYLDGDEALGIYAENRLIGGLGSLAPLLLQRWDLQTPVAVLELDLAFLATMTAPHILVSELTQQPGIQI